jgi:hypothetical protein
VRGRQGYQNQQEKKRGKKMAVSSDSTHPHFCNIVPTSNVKPSKEV